MAQHVGVFVCVSIRVCTVRLDSGSVCGVLCVYKSPRRVKELTVWLQLVG